MKKIICILLLIAVSMATTATDVTNVVSGQEITLDGTSQKLSLKMTTTLRQLVIKQGYATLFFYIDAAGGARIGNEAIVDGTHKLYAQDARVIITVIPGEVDVYVKGTNGQKITVSF